MVPKDKNPPKLPLQDETFTGAVQEPFSLSRDQPHRILSSYTDYPLATSLFPSHGFRIVSNMDRLITVSRWSPAGCYSNTTTNY